MKNPLFLLAFFALTGCYTERKAMQQTVRAYSAYPGPFAVQVAGWFPPKISTTTETIYRAGLTTYDTAFVMVDCDSVLRETKNNSSLLSGPKVNLVRVPCPPSTVRVDTFFKETVRSEENTIALNACQYENTALRAARSMEEGYKNIALRSKTFWQKIAWAGIGLLILNLVAGGFWIARKMNPVRL